VNSHFHLREQGLAQKKNSAHHQSGLDGEASGNATKGNEDRRIRGAGGDSLTIKAQKAK